MTGNKPSTSAAASLGRAEELNLRGFVSPGEALLQACGASHGDARGNRRTPPHKETTETDPEKRSELTCHVAPGIYSHAN